MRDREDVQRGVAKLTERLVLMDLDADRFRYMSGPVTPSDPYELEGSYTAMIERLQGLVVGDEAKAEVAKLYDMIHPNASSGPRTAVDNATVRSVFLIGPDKKIKLMLTYPMSTGRNFDEILRVLDSLALTEEFKVATPVNWQQGDDVIIASDVYIIAGGHDINHPNFNF